MATVHDLRYSGADVSKELTDLELQELSQKLNKLNIETKQRPHFNLNTIGAVVSWEGGQVEGLYALQGIVQVHKMEASEPLFYLDTVGIENFLLQCLEAPTK